MLLKKYQLLIAFTLFVACIQKNVRTDRKDFKKTLDIKLKNFVTKDSLLNKAAKANKQIKSSIWINQNFKKYLLGDTVSVSSILPFTLTIEKERFFLTYKYEGAKIYSSIKDGSLKQVNDSVINIHMKKQNISFLKTVADDNGTPDLSTELNRSILDYRKLTAIIDINSKDTISLVATKPTWTHEVYCSTNTHNLKYKIFYSYPVIFEGNITHSKYYLKVYGLLPLEKTYELILKNKKYELRDLETSKIVYEFLMR
ncbi:hypothetical protein SAMN05421827_12716 [Pedobacter terrae]|uniref:Uncharacterized protein n=1 Tax=Pedobacter terrae TaxID=405671 RepID=A0A1G8CXE9_9SPHI|nr:hypothetical protein [Pedobacter terrae]SDH50044.1 hypothetical protein SAMN05421827_12716 [Pedobacter terrae]